MAAGGDCVELVHEQTYLGQIVNNVYFFEAVSEATLVNLATWFETNVVNRVKGVQIDLVTHTNLRLRNLFNLSENYEEPLTGTGTLGAGVNELPSFMAYTIRLDHDNGSVRPGFKRYCGVDESNLADALVSSGRIATLETLAGELINPPTTANILWAHVIVNRICETANPIPGAVPACLKYRLPENQGEFNPGYPISFEAYAQPTTQNSRKWYT